MCTVLPDSPGRAVRNTYLVAYDIANATRLRRVHKAMLGFGDRLQYSVFECRFSRSDLAHCKHTLGRLIHHRDDQVLFVDLGPSDGRGERVITTIGRASSSVDSPCIVVDGHDETTAPAGTKRSQEALEQARTRRAARNRYVEST